MSQESFEGWAIVEIMGHQRYAGYCSQISVGGGAMLRVDVPECEGHSAFTKLFGVSSIYAITPMNEEIVRGVAAKSRSCPLSFYELPEDWQAAINSHRDRPSLEGPDANVDAEELDDPFLDDDHKE